MKFCLFHDLIAARICLAPENHLGDHSFVNEELIANSEINRLFSAVTNPQTKQDPTTERGN